MILDTLSQLKNYQSLHPNLIHVIEFLNQIDISTFQLDSNFVQHPDFKVIQVIEKQGSNKTEAVLEAHNANIDIHIGVSGTETIGWKPRQNCTQPKAEFSVERDAIFFEDEPSHYVILEKKQFVMLFPEDAHNGMIGNDLISKLIIKLKI